MNVGQLLSSLRENLSGARTKDVAAGIARFHRIQASPGYDEAAGYVVELLQRADIEHRVHEYPADGTTRTFEWTAPPAWMVRSGWLRQQEPEERRLCLFDETPQAVVAHSAGGIADGELVHVAKGDADADYAGKDVAGNIVLACGRASQVSRQAVKRGAVAIVVYPDSERAAASHDLVPYHGLFPKASEISTLVPTFSISRRTADRLIKTLGKGPVRLHGEVDAEFIDNSLRVIEAWVPGSDGATRDVLLTAHLCHPRQSANDNASGSAVLVEIARTLRRLRSELGLRDTVRFLWVPEFYGTLPWSAAHCDQLKRVEYVLNLDMVGQSPDGIGEPLRVSRVPNAVPSYLNAMVEPIAEGVAAMSDGFASGGSRRRLQYLLDVPIGGSDHLVFAAAPHQLPAIMLNHDDPYWHTDLDSIDKVDPSRLQHVGMIAAALAALPWADERERVRLCEWVLSYGVRELCRASGLSRELDPGRGTRILDAALGIEEARVHSLARRFPDRQLAAHLEGQIGALREVHRHLTASVPRADARHEPRDDVPRPIRAIDGPLVYTVTESFDEEEKAFFDDKLSPHHRAVAECLLNLCDGTRTVEEIALRLSLDFGRILAVRDVERGVELLGKAGYIRR